MSNKGSRKAKIRAALAQVPLFDDDTEDHIINHENLKGKGNLDTSFVKDTPEADEVKHIQHNVLENAPEIIEHAKNEDPEEYVNISELQTSNVVPPENCSYLNKKDVIEKWQGKLNNTNTSESKEIGKNSRRAKIAAALAQISLFDDSSENHSISHENQKREGNIYIASLHNTHFVKVALEADKTLSLQCNRMENCSERVEYINVNKDSEDPVNNHELQTNNVDHPENRKCLSKKDMIEKWQGNLDTYEMKLVTNAVKEKEVKSEPEELKIRSKSIYIIENKKHVTDKEEIDKKTCTPKNTVENAVNEAKPLIEHEKTEKEIFKKELELFHCPFTWNLNYNHKGTSELFIACLNEKLQEIKEDFVFQWRKFILSLVICHELYICGNFSEALSKQRECEVLINEFESSETPDKFLQNVKKALSHVVDACKCHLLLSLGLLMDARKLKGQISSFEEMNDQNKAAIFGIQSAVLLEYGYDGTKAALECVEKAIKLDENEEEWHFLLGKVLGRLRRINTFNEIPTSRELSALERAVKTSKKASYMVFLAQAYRETAFKSYSIHKNNLGPLEATLNKMNEQSKDLYRKALEANGECAHINIRCAQGFLKLPFKFRDVPKAKECIDKALKLAPRNPMVNHVAGFFNERFLSNIDLAEKFYRTAGENGAYGACMDIMRIKFLKDNKYNPLPDLEQLLQDHRDLPRVQETTLQMGTYCYLIKNDLLAALNYWMKVIEKQPESEKLQAHKCSLLQMKTPINLYQVIVDEIQLTLKQKSLTAENMHRLRKILHNCIKKYPQLLCSEPQSWRELVWKEHSNRSYPHVGQGKSKVNQHRKDVDQSLCHKGGFGRKGNHSHNQENGNERGENLGHYNEKRSNRENDKLKGIWSDSCKSEGIQRCYEHGNFVNQKNSIKGGYNTQENRSKSEERLSCRSKSQENKWKMEGRKGEVNEISERKRETYRSDRSSSQESVGSNSQYRNKDNSKLKNDCISHDSSVNSCDSNYGIQVPKRGSRYTSNRSGEDKTWKSVPIPNEMLDLKQTHIDSMSSVDRTPDFTPTRKGSQKNFGGIRNWNQSCYERSRTETHTRDKTWKSVPIPNEMLDLKQTHIDSMSSVDRTPDFIPTRKGSQKNFGGIRNWNQSCYEGSGTETHTRFSRNESWRSNGKEQQRLQGDSSRDALQPKKNLSSSEQETNLNRNREYETKYGKNRFGKDQVSDKGLFVTDENMWKGAGDPAMGFRRRRDDLKNKDKMHH